MTYHVEFPGLGLAFTLDRVAFTVFGVPIYWYGILIATGLALALLFAFAQARRFGIDSDRMVDVVLIGTVCAIVGGRAYYVATAPFEYGSFWEMLDIRLGGVAIYGAVIAAFLGGYFACKWRKVPVLPMFDLAGMGFLLGQGIGRWGNFVNQEAFGTNTTLPWGMYSEGTYNYLAGVQGTLAAQGIVVDPSQPVHPTFLYESIWCLLGFFLLWAYIRHRRFHGEMILMYVIWYGVERFFVEGLRTDSLMVGPLRISQVVAAVSVVAGVILWAVLRRRHAGKPLTVTYTAIEKEADGPAVYSVFWRSTDKTPTAEELKEKIEAARAARSAQQTDGEAQAETEKTQAGPDEENGKADEEADEGGPLQAEPPVAAGQEKPQGQCAEKVKEAPADDARPAESAADAKGSGAKGARAADSDGLESTGCTAQAGAAARAEEKLEGEEEDGGADQR